MKLHRLFGLFIRYMYYFRKSWDRLSDAFYWPAIDVLVWGITSAYVKKIAPDFPQIVLIIMSGLLLWLILWRAQYEISINLLEEFWNRNLINIFVSPVKFSEWVLTVMLLGLVKAIFSLPFAAILAYLLYKFNIFLYGFYMIPFILILFMTGWAVGFFVSGLILRFGTKIQTFAWTTIGLLSPLVAVYYPVSILPPAIQKISYLLPPTYVFEAGRSLIFKGLIDTQGLVISFILNIFYLILSIWFLKLSFDKILNKGLIKPH
ncbi:MAG: ABC transporter permease [Patescibacteria group bacterium]